MNKTTKKEVKLPTKPTTKRDTHFYDMGSREQAIIFNNTPHVFECDLDDVEENATQVKKDISWGKWDIQINWCAVLLAIMLGVIISRMIIDIGYGFINA